MFAIETILLDAKEELLLLDSLHENQQLAMLLLSLEANVIVPLAPNHVELSKTGH